MSSMPSDGAARKCCLTVPRSGEDKGVGRDSGNRLAGRLGGRSCRRGSGLGWRERVDWWLGGREAGRCCRIQNLMESGTAVAQRRHEGGDVRPSS